MEVLCPCADQEGVEGRVDLKRLVEVPFAREVGKEDSLPAPPVAPQSFQVHHLRPPSQGKQDSIPGRGGIL